jgi:hypothetical protein
VKNPKGRKSIHVYVNGGRAVFECSDGSRIAVELKDDTLRIAATRLGFDGAVPMILNSSMVETSLEIEVPHGR